MQSHGTRCPHSTRCGVYVTVGCASVRPSVCLSVPSTAAAFRSISAIGVMIADWANDWQLSVSVDKCSVLKIGCGTAVDADFILSGNVLPTVNHCRDLGVAIVSDLSSTQYISEIVSEAHQRGNCIMRSFSSGAVCTTRA